MKLGPIKPLFRSHLIAKGSKKRDARKGGGGGGEERMSSCKLGIRTGTKHKTNKDLR